MWNPFLILFFSGPLWHLVWAETVEDIEETEDTAVDLLLTADDLLTGADDLQLAADDLLLTEADTADELLLNEAVELLQIDIVQRLEESLRLTETSLKEREREIFFTKAELERTKTRLEEKLEKSWTLVKFMLKVVKKSQGAAKAREELMVTQATMLKQLKVEVVECKANIADSLKLVTDSQEVIRGQRETIEDLKSIVLEESSLNATYQEIMEANSLKTNCDVPSYMEDITNALSTQEKEIELLKQTVASQANVVDLLTGISKGVVQGAAIVSGGEARNWEVLEQCQDVLEKQSSGLDMLKTLASERVTRDNSLRFRQDRDGHIVSASFCQCIPDPSYPQRTGSEVSLNLVATREDLTTWMGTPDTWSPMWSAWQSKDCDLVTLSNGTKIWRGEGGWSRKRLKDLSARSWEEEVEEVACPNTVLHARCFEYHELNWSQRRTWEGSHQFSCDGSTARTRDWKGPGWYRITGQAGAKLIESPVEDFHCGTRYGGWMSGGHPTFDQGEVSRTINFNDSSSTNQAKVINCGTYYRASLKKRSLVIPALLEALGCSKGMNISQKHCQSSFFG